MSQYSYKYWVAPIMLTIYYLEECLTVERDKDIQVNLPSGVMASPIPSSRDMYILTSFMPRTSCWIYRSALKSHRTQTSLQQLTTLFRYLKNYRTTRKCEQRETYTRSDTNLRRHFNSWQLRYTEQLRICFSSLATSLSAVEWWVSSLSSPTVSRIWRIHLHPSFLSHLSGSVPSSKHDFSVVKSA